MDLTWHKMSERFESVESLRSKISAAFKEYVSNASSFQVGFLCGKGCQKRWIVSEDDLGLMYKEVGDEKEIRLWCEGKVKDSEVGLKRKCSDEDCPVKSKREKNEDKENSIRVKLEEKHGDKYTVPQYILWAKFIRIGRHDSYDDPPPIPLITGQQKGSSHKKESLTDVISSAATAISQALKPKTPPTTPVSKATSKSTLSPNNHAALRRHNLEDLKILSQLFNDGVLTSAEFSEQKEAILSSLRKLS